MHTAVDTTGLKDLLAKGEGKQVFLEEKDKVYPVQHVTCPALSQASEAFVNKHRFTGEKTMRQVGYFVLCFHTLFWMSYNAQSLL